MRKDDAHMFTITISPLTRELLLCAAQGMPDRQAMISIMDHKRDCKQRYPAPRVLRLCFDDAVDTLFWQNLMTLEQARAIRDFVLQYQDEIDELIVHCTEGVSRSAAVAAGTLIGCGCDDTWIWNDPRYRPNKYVYALVREAFAESGL